MKSIDVHAHVGTPEADGMLVKDPGFHAQLAAEAASLGPVSAAYNREHFGALGGRLTDVAERLRAMDEGGVDVQMVSATPIARHWMSEELAERYVAAVNEAVAEHCATTPERLLPIASVALHIPDLAASQLHSAVRDLGALGVQISTTAGDGVELDAPQLDAFWQAAVDDDVPVLIHPWGCSLGERLDVGYMFNHVGNPTETSVALSRLIFGGVLDRFPALRIWGAHAGGWLPSYTGRADHAWHARADARTCEHPPSWYLQHRVWVDALTYSAPSLRFLVESLGPDRVTLGTDYPFDMGVADPVARVEAALDDTAHRQAVCSASAHELFGPGIQHRLLEENER